MGLLINKAKYGCRNNYNKMTKCLPNLTRKQPQHFILYDGADPGGTPHHRRQAARAKTSQFGFWLASILLLLWLPSVRSARPPFLSEVYAEHDQWEKEFVYASPKPPVREDYALDTHTIQMSWKMVELQTE